MSHKYWGKAHFADDRMGIAWSGRISGETGSYYSQKEVVRLDEDDDFGSSKAAAIAQMRKAAALAQMREAENERAFREAKSRALQEKLEMAERAARYRASRGMK